MMLHINLFPLPYLMYSQHQPVSTNPSLQIMSEEHSEEIKSLKHTVYGNGRPGLTDRVTVIETKLSTGTRLLWALLLLSLPPLIDLFKSIK